MSDLAITVPWLAQIASMRGWDAVEREAERIRALVRGTGRFHFALHVAYQRLFRKEGA